MRRAYLRLVFDNKGEPYFEEMPERHDPEENIKGQENKPTAEEVTGMSLGEARAIFEMIGDEGISDEKKAEAVQVILSMPTHNSVSKDSLLVALRWAMERGEDKE